MKENFNEDSIKIKWKLKLISKILMIDNFTENSIKTKWK